MSESKHTGVYSPKTFGELNYIIITFRYIRTFKSTIFKKCKFQKCKFKTSSLNFFKLNFFLPLLATSVFFKCKLLKYLNVTYNKVQSLAKYQRANILDTDVYSSKTFGEMNYLYYNYT